MGMTGTFDQVVEEYHRANCEFARGNPEPLQHLFSHREDVTLLNPFGGVALGWEQVSQTQERNASLFGDGEETDFERVATCVTPELGLIVEVERHRTRTGGRQEMVSLALRVTTVFRPEDGTWKVVHRHADPIASPRPPESIMQQ
jgi:ketosteroid isomerase-like protein